MSKTPISKQLAKVLYRIEVAAKACGRNPKEITLICVSKGQSIEDIQKIYRAGSRDFGENRLNEALEKQLSTPSDIHWHLIGTLQSNKVNKVVGNFSLIHSVDSLDLAKKISKSAQGMQLTQDILLQVNISKEATKHGMTALQCIEHFPEFLELPNIRVKGLMTIAPLQPIKAYDDKDPVRLCFRGLKELKEKLQPKVPKTYDAFTELSMGMSQDFEIAIQEGATLVRIGSAVFASNHD